MNNENEKLAQSKQTAIKTIYEAFKLLKENNGQFTRQGVFKELKNRLQFSEWELEEYESGGIRWQKILMFYTITCVKAGFMRKSKGIWYLTAEGEKELEYTPEEVLQHAIKGYKRWDKERQNFIGNETEPDIDIMETRQKINLEELEEQSLEGLKEYIKSINAYDFQDVVAALLRAMGYYTPYIAPPGKDGGIDIIAYQDPLGAEIPRIKVQVKHRPEDAVSVKEIRSLLGLLNKDGEIGLFVTSGRFSKDAEKEARASHTHCRLIDFNDFISLWQQFYSKLTDEDKNMLPLKAIYFLGTNE
ncbi:MAG: restriction endonuclease [Bacteroidetes bacterium]|nr:restriction endonuclease [Bacteroidota bacterium]